MVGSGRAIRAGAAAIEILADDSNFTSSLRRATKTLNDYGRTVRNVGAAVGAAGAGMTVALGSMIATTMRAQANYTRFGLIMRGQTEAMLAQLRDLSDRTNVGMTRLVDMSATFGAIFASMREQVGDQGYAGQVMKATQVTLDLAASMGITFAEAGERIKSMLTSTGEAVDQFGINVRQAEINLALQTLGIKKNVRQMAEMEKQIVKLQIAEQLLVKNELTIFKMQDTLSVQYSTLLTQLEDIKASAGEFAAPVLKNLFKMMNAILKLPFAKEMAKIGGALLSIVGPSAMAIGGGLATFGLAMQGLSQVPNMVRALNSLRTAQLATAFGSMVGWLVQVPNFKTALISLTALWSKLAAAIWSAAAATSAFTKSTLVLTIAAAVLAVAEYMTKTNQPAGELGVVSKAMVATKPALRAVGAYYEQEFADRLLPRSTYESRRRRMQDILVEAGEALDKLYPLKRQGIGGFGGFRDIPPAAPIERAAAGALVGPLTARALAFGPAGAADTTNEILNQINENIVNVVDKDAIRVVEADR